MICEKSLLEVYYISVEIFLHVRWNVDMRRPGTCIVKAFFGR